MANGGLDSLLDVDDDLHQTDLVADQAKQLHLIMEMRNQVQNPPLGEFCFQDLEWTKHVTNGKGKYKNSMLAVIFWDRLPDFIQGEQHHPLYPCKFTKEIIRVTAANSLRSPRANSAAMVVRFVLLNIDLI